MATLSFEYGKKKKDDSIAVDLLLRHAHEKKRIKTGVQLLKDEYRICKDGKVKILNTQKLYALQEKQAELQKRMNDTMLATMGLGISIDALYESMMRKDKRSVQNMNFIEYIDKWIERRKDDIKGIKNYTCMRNDLVRYLDGVILHFDMFDYKFLCGYKMSLKDRTRAQSLYLGALRRIWREACLEFNTDNNIILSPMLFERFKVPKQKMVGQRAIGLDEIRNVFRYQPKTKREELARDCCMLSFCLMGTNSVDLFNATSLKAGIFSYDRAKTKDRRADSAHIEIVVPDAIQHLIKKYRSKDGRHVFNFSERYSNEREFNRGINIGLKGIGKSVGIHGLTFYQFRHAYASVARNNLHVPKSDVDELLNHVGGNKIVDLYIKKDYGIVNEINQRVVDYVLNGVF